MKRTWKRTFALILTLCLLMGLASCAGKEAATTDDAKPVAAGPASALDKNDGTPLPAAEAPDRPADDGTVVEYFYDGAAAEMEPEYGGGKAAEGGESPAAAASGAPEAPGTPDAPGEGDEPVIVEDPAAPAPDVPRDPGEALKLTAAEWNDNQNWPFFTNLVNAGTVSFPSFGVDPRNRIRVTVTDADGAALPNEEVSLLAGDTVLWTARTDRSGVAYLFHPADTVPDRVVSGEAEAPVQVREGGDAQNPGVLRPADDIALTKTPAAPAQAGLQVMFIVDTTGSMSDELAYLQKDFSAIAGRVGAEGVRYAVSFYRDEGDEYVTRHSEFTSDVAAIQARINAEYADGGGDEPEAVAEVLTECLTQRTDWEENAAKLAFLIFDAPPHGGREAELLAAVRAAAEKGVHLIPVVASNSARDTELFGRALAICTNGTYVFLTDDSGVGESHLEPIVGDYTVELLQDLIVRIIESYRPE